MLIEGGENSWYPQDFTSIAMETLNFILYKIKNPVIYNLMKIKIEIRFLSKAL
jgi:hypothetical protein